jgi:oligopeptide transport system substrate-binding protein
LKRPDFHQYDYLGTFFYRFNVTQKPFADARVRRAFAFATDKQHLVDKILRGGEKVATHFVPDGVAGNTSPAGLSYNPGEARRMLAEAGFPGGKGFPTVSYSFYSAASGSAKLQGRIAVELQQMWQEQLGIEVELRQVERTIFFSAQSRLEYVLSASSWIGDYDDPNTFLELFVSNSGNNRTGWKNPRYDQLIHEANRQTDLQRRAALFREAESLLIAEEVPIGPIFFYAGFNYFDPNKIEGITQNLLDEHPLQDIRRVTRRHDSGAQANGTREGVAVKTVQQQ